jgi:hypothetical protein
VPGSHRQLRDTAHEGAADSQNMTIKMDGIYALRNSIASIFCCRSADQ